MAWHVDTLTYRKLKTPDPACALFTEPACQHPCASRPLDCNLVPSFRSWLALVRTLREMGVRADAHRATVVASRVLGVWKEHVADMRGKYEVAERFLYAKGR